MRARVAALSCSLLGCVLWGAPAAAQVAIAPLVEAKDAVHRDIVGAVAASVAARAQMLSPQLTVDDVRECKDEVRCVLRIAQERGASHVVLVSVAPLGPRDEAVAVQLYRAGEPDTALLDESAVLTTRHDVRQAAAAIGAKVAAVDGLPARPVPAIPETPTAERGPLSYVALGLLGGAAVVGAAAVVVGSVALGGATANPEVLSAAIIGGSAGAGALALGGIALLVVDEP